MPSLVCPWFLFLEISLPGPARFHPFIDPLHCGMLEWAHPFIASPVLGKGDPGFLEQSGKPIGHWSAVISHLWKSL